jgi:Uma2 family endonuclease
MAATLRKIKLTYDDYRLFPNDGRRHELIDGEHIMSPSPKSKHQNAESNLTRLLGNFVRQKKLGKVYPAPFDVILSEFDVVEPDLLFIAAARVGKLVQDWVRGAPDLVIEILSESTEAIDRTLKFKQYEQFGVREYWIVDPEAEIVEVYVLRAQGYESLAKVRGGERIESKVLPGLDFHVAEIFE